MGIFFPIPLNSDQHLNHNNFFFLKKKMDILEILIGFKGKF
jgi:hypothetical protein